MTTAVLTSTPPAPARVLRFLLLAIGGALLGLVLGVLVVATVATRVFDYELLTVRSGSMEPSIARGDLIVVKPAAMASIAEGDVILFRAGGEAVPTVHRVVGINEVEVRIADAVRGTVESHTQYRFVTRGDANESPDLHEVTGGEFMGEVWFSVPGGGAFTGLPLQYALLAIGGASFAAWTGWEVRQYQRRRR